ncbi:MAG: GNAT family N-acetyltransferase [Nocardioidaceae bacterium]
MRIREADVDDLEAVLALLAEDAIREVAEPAEVTARQRAAMAELVADDHQCLLVGEIDGRIVATATVTWLRVLIYDGGLVCQVESVRTASDLRGRGHGRDLMQHVVALARQRGCARVQLTTNARRTRAHEFYRRLSFRPSHVGMKLYLTAGS